MVQLEFFGLSMHFCADLAARPIASAIALENGAKEGSFPSLENWKYGAITLTWML